MISKQRAVGCVAVFTCPLAPALRERVSEARPQCRRDPPKEGHCKLVIGKCKLVIGGRRTRVGCLGGSSICNLQLQICNLLPNWTHSHPRPNTKLLNGAECHPSEVRPRTVVVKLLSQLIADAIHIVLLKRERGLRLLGNRLMRRVGRGELVRVDRVSKPL